MINSKLVLILTIPLLVLSCRKKINLTKSNSGWERLGSADARIDNICQFNDEIYVEGNLGLATNLNNVNRIGKYNDNGQIVDILSGNFLGVSSSTSTINVTDMELHNNNLYFSGDFKLLDASFNVIGENLIYFDGIDYHPVNCNDGSSAVVIRDLESYNDELIVTGTFLANTYFKSRSIDRLKNNSFIGFQNLFNQRMSAGNNGEIYSLGVSNTDVIQRWTGTSWESISYEGSLPSVVEFYNNTLYLGGSINSKPLLMYDGTDWVDVDQISGIIHGMKVINGILYLYGKDLLINDMTKSSVISFDGTVWEPIGNLSPVVRDLELINDNFYAGTSVGLFVFNEK